jgi:hypothetical protein
MSDLKGVHAMRRILVFTVAMAVMLLGVAVLASATESANVNRFDGKNLPPWADATLVRGEDAVSAVIETHVGGDMFELDIDPPDVEVVPQGTKWKVGDATTMWWVIWNNPEGCEDGCGPDDLARSLVDGNDLSGTVGVLPATGSVATSGRWSASATLAEGVIPPYAVVPIPLGDAATAEVHLVVRSHGPASNFTADQLVEALTTIDGGCGINTCGDAQDVIFLPPQP